MLEWRNNPRNPKCSGTVKRSHEHLDGCTLLRLLPAPRYQRLSVLGLMSEEMLSLDSNHRKNDL